MQFGSTSSNSVLQIEDVGVKFGAITSEIDLQCLDSRSLEQLVESSVRLLNRVQAFVAEVGVCAVGKNVHRMPNSNTSSGASWLAEKTGTSLKKAKSLIVNQKELNELPNVKESLRSGELSPDKADVIAKASKNCGDNASRITSELLDAAKAQSVDELQREALELTLRNCKDQASRQQTIRKRQFVSISQGNDKENAGMVIGSFRLDVKSATWIPQFEKLKKQILKSDETEIGYSAQIAEAFSNIVASGLGIRSTSGVATKDKGHSEQQIRIKNKTKRMGKRAEICFHIDLKLGPDGKLIPDEICQVPGLGPILTSSIAEDVLEEASRSLVGTVDNKMTWFSEQDRRRKDTPLPEYMKRAVAARDRGICSNSGCFNPIDDIDHNLAKTNNGNHDPENLQGLCGECHGNKTRIDAPWTVGGIYGKNAMSPPSTNKYSQRPQNNQYNQYNQYNHQDQLFRNTGTG